MDFKYVQISELIRRGTFASSYPDKFSLETYGNVPDNNDLMRIADMIACNYLYGNDPFNWKLNL